MSGCNDRGQTRWDGAGPAGGFKVSRLDGKVAIVTGAGGRLGHSCARLFAQRGAAVIAADIDVEAAADTARIISEEGGRARPHGVQISDGASVKSMIDAALAHFGGLDVLINFAGLVGREFGIGLLDLAEDVWDEVQAVNLKGTFLACKHAVPPMIDRGGGSIINISSNSSLVGDIQNLAYAASKGGVNVLTTYVATEFGRQNIRCNAISPGVMLRQQDFELLSQDRLDMYGKILEHTMLPRIGSPEDIAHTAAFLASDDSAYITGQLLPVDGGFSRIGPHVAELRRRRGSA